MVLKRLSSWGLMGSMIFSLTACASTPSLETNVCNSFRTWITSGPRESSGDRRIIIPPSSDCYYEDYEIPITCLRTDIDCPEGADCEDSADVVFRKDLYKPAHYWTEYDYFEVFNICLGTLKNRTHWVSREVEQNQSFKTSYRKSKVTLSYDADEMLTTIVVLYPDS